MFVCLFVILLPFVNNFSIDFFPFPFFVLCVYDRLGIS